MEESIVWLMFCRRRPCAGARGSARFGKYAFGDSRKLALLGTLALLLRR